MTGQQRVSRWILLVIGLMVLVGCGGGDQQPTEPAQAARSLTIVSVEGAAQVRMTPDAEPADASPDQMLAVGAEVITGADGQVVLAMDDGTTIVIPSESSFVVQALEGTPESPVSRFFLNLGEVFAFREGDLPEDASFEIETPNGVGAIRGSMIRLAFNPVTGQVEATCMTGHCSLTAAGVTVDLTGGQSVIVEGFDLPPGEVFVIDDSQLQAWIDAAAAAGTTIQLTGVLPEATPEVTEEPEPECACVGPDLVCDDGAVNQDHEDCIASCTCEGPDFVCDDGTVLEDDEECLASCACEGPDFVCDDGTISEDDEDCLAACACESYDLVCDDGSVIEGHEECGGCLCEGYNLVCNGELAAANSAECGWVCDPALTCGNGTCDTECENSDVCPDDCVCIDDGLCVPGEGFGCHDCIGPDEDPSSACGVPCQEICSGDLACVEGFCWDPCLCGGSCGEEERYCPVTCVCLDSVTQQCTDCDGNTWLEGVEWCGQIPI